MSIIKSTPGYTLTEPAYLIPGYDPTGPGVIMVCTECSKQSPTAESIDDSPYINRPVCEACGTVMAYTEASEAPHWVREFGGAYGVPQEVLATPGMVDISWHNDVMPSFAFAECDGSDGKPEVRLWVDHVVPEARECYTVDDPGDRYGVCDHETQETTHNGNDLAEALVALRVATDEALARRAAQDSGQSPVPCAECARSFGPHYTGKCSH